MDSDYTDRPLCKEVETLVWDDEACDVKYAVVKERQYTLDEIFYTSLAWNRRGFRPILTVNFGALNV